MALQFQGRRLSPVRLITLIVIVLIVTGAGLFYWQRAEDSAAAERSDRWFGAYVDLTSTPFYDVGAAVEKGETVVFGFAVADPETACEPSWGGYYSLDEAAQTFDLDRRAAQVHSKGGQIAISTGGLLNDELATACHDSADVAAGYEKLLNRYDSSILDLDIEGDDLLDEAAGQRRAEAVKKLMQKMDVKVWLTLPAATFGLAPEGVAEVNRMLEAGVDVAGVNLMTMNFGETRTANQSMAEASMVAASNAHAQLKTAYQSVGKPLGDNQLWRKIGVTPMIGQNDLLGEIFTLDDAQDLSAFVLEKNLGRVSFWSANRDRDCGANYPDLTRVSNNCSGVAQDPGQFAAALSSGIGDFNSAPPVEETPRPSLAPQETAIADDPEKSPYPIWNDQYAYVAGDRTVWRQNVYEAKWWNQGEAPDGQVDDGQSSAWTLIGPVLPGDKPVKVVTAPKGLYPQWSADATYEKNDRVLFEGRVLEAKWWNESQSPEAALQGATNSPWSVLDNAEVQRLIDENQGTQPTEKVKPKPSPSKSPAAKSSSD